MSLNKSRSKIDIFLDNISKTDIQKEKIIKLLILFGFVMIFILLFQFFRLELYISLF